MFKIFKKKEVPMLNGIPVTGEHIGQHVIWTDPHWCEGEPDTVRQYKIVYIPNYKTGEDQYGLQKHLGSFYSAFIDLIDSKTLLNRDIKIVKDI